MNVYIRPLIENDALTSYKWRNNPKIWELTGSKPNILVTPEIELEWIRTVLYKNDQKRYAICIKDTDEYIGNVQITNIKDHRGEFHIFLGNTNYWGKGIGKKATWLMIDFGFTKLGLEEIYLWVNKFNNKAIKIYKDLGFEFVNNNDIMIYMVISRCIKSKK